MLRYWPLLLAARGALGHGWVVYYETSTSNTTGWDPWLGYKEGSNAPVRRYPSPDPINGVDNPAILCRGDNKPVATSAMVNAGDTMTVFWSGYGGGMWEGDEYPGPANMAHNHLGPILTYMASCAGPCSSFDATGKVWFKIDESKTWDGPNLKWATQTLRENGSRYSFQLPPDLKAGEYMLRHEIIALHNARTPGGAQFYPHCLQMTVKGEGSLVVTDHLVSFPGAYSDSDPGIVLDIYSPMFDSTRQYSNPGPPLYSSSPQSPPEDDIPSSANSRGRQTSPLPSASANPQGGDLSGQPPSSHSRPFYTGREAATSDLARSYAAGGSVTAPQASLPRKSVSAASDSIILQSSSAQSLSCCRETSLPALTGLGICLLIFLRGAT